MGDKAVFAQEVMTTKFLEELVPLLHLHWKEVAHFKDIRLNPNLKFYKDLEQAKILRVYTIRKTEKLVGYAVFFVQKDPHHQHSVQAVQDLLFLSPSLRAKLIGYRFLKWCDKQLTKEGVEVIYHGVKKSHNFGLMLEKLGYECVDLIYARRV